ncbi:hypothetical protein L195_g031971 [Trifolium pratense]|uniref:Uncharacterized protein n=2 Tax=Trifolium pratense TaxID=57577 RepID=A0A2K3LBW8_TRIPR|nr:hypothetical protein L195_g031971 [Trifolium pratense]
MNASSVVGPVRGGLGAKHRRVPGLESFGSALGARRRLGCTLRGREYILLLLHLLPPRESPRERKKGFGKGSSSNQHQSRVTGGFFWVYSRVGDVIITPCNNLSLKSLGHGKRFGKKGRNRENLFHATLLY